MTDLRQAAQQALEALAIADNIALVGAAYTPKSIDHGLRKIRESATALRTALEQPEPEKVAWRFWVGDWQYVCDERMLHHLDKDVFFEPLYTMPPKQRKKIDPSPMQEAAQMLRDRAAKQRKDNGND
jgi:hypothetical protein